MSWAIHTGDVLEVLPSLEAGSFDAVLSDPPYGLGFMGKAWDSPGKTFFERKPERSNRFDHVGGNHNPTDSADRQRTRLSENAKMQAWVESWGTALHRVLRPGAHVLAFGGTRTFHRLAVGIEDAGFEIRDCLSWLYGSGFPKSLAIDKAIDKARGVVGSLGAPKSEAHAGWIERGRMRGDSGHEGYQRPWMEDPEAVEANARRYIPADPTAASFAGYGTALKPAWEPCLVAMKPLDGTFAENALTHGVAGLNVDGGRIESIDGTSTARTPSPNAGSLTYAQDAYTRTMLRGGNGSPIGRWPANVLLDEAAAERLDGEVGELKSGGGRKSWRTSDGWAGGALGPLPGESAADSGGPSRFFYCAKASRREREAGLEGFESRSAAERTGRADGSAGLHTSARPNVEGGNPYAGQSSGRARNHHPTVKPVALCEYLARLILPPDTGRPRRLLVPFSGSGSEMIGALRAGWDEVVGIELDPEYVAIAEARLRHWASDEHLPAGEDATPGGPEQIALFDLEAASA